MKPKFHVLPRLALLAATLLSALALATCKMPLLSRDMVNYAKSEGGLAATASNKKVSLEWVADPTATSYALYYTADGSTPSTSNGTKVASVSPPYSFTHDNGDLCGFLVVATYANGTIKSLGPVSAIPLSPLTLAPSLVSGTGQITVSWKGINATNDFVLFRRAGESGAFASYREVLGTQFVDTAVSNGVTYYYKVAPKSDTSQVSAAAAAETDGLSSGSSVATLSWPFQGSSYGSATQIKQHGDYIYASGFGTIYYPSIHSSLPNGNFVRKLISVASASDPSTEVGLIAETETGYATTIDSSYVPPSTVIGTAFDTCFFIESGHEYLAIAEATRGVSIFNIDTPSSPQFVSSITLSGGRVASGILFDSGRLYVAETVWDGSRYVPTLVECWDVTSPASPSLGSVSFDLSGAGSPPTISVWNPLRMAISGTTLFVADETNGCYVFDTTGTGLKTHAAHSALAPSGGNVTDLALSSDGSYLYLAAQGTGILAVKCSDWSLSSTLNDLWALSIAVSGPYGYVENPQVGLQTLDLSNSGSPSIIKVNGLPMFFGGPQWSTVTVYQSQAFVCNGANANLGYFGSYQIGLNLPYPAKYTSLGLPYAPTALALAGSHLLVGTATGLAVYDLANTTAAPVTTLSNHMSASGHDNSIRGIAVSGDYAYIIDSAHGLSVIDVSSPMAPKWLRDLSSDEPYAIAISAGYAYVAERYGSLQVWDLGDPASPSLAQTITVGSDITRIQIAGDYAYMMGHDGIYVLDISSRANPAMIRFISIYGVQSMDLRGNSLLCTATVPATGRIGYEVITIAAPALSEDTIPGAALLPGGSDSALAYTAAGPYGILSVGSGSSAHLLFVDLTDVSSPKTLTSIACPIYPGFPAGSDRLVYGNSFITTTQGTAVDIYQFLP